MIVHPTAHCTLVCHSRAQLYIAVHFLANHHLQCVAQVHSDWAKSRSSNKSVSGHKSPQRIEKSSHPPSLSFIHFWAQQLPLALSLSHSLFVTLTLAYLRQFWLRRCAARQRAHRCVCACLCARRRLPQGGGGRGESAQLQETLEAHGSCRCFGRRKRDVTLGGKGRGSTAS